MAPSSEDCTAEECAESMVMDKVLDSDRLSHTSLSPSPTPSLLDPTHQPPPTFSTLPNELKIHILRYALYVHRVSPRLSDKLGPLYPILTLSLVSHLIHTLSRRIFYSENTLAIHRMLPPSSLFSLASSCSFDLVPTIRVPSPTIRPLITRLEIVIAISKFWTCDPETYIRDHLAPLRDMGVLLRPVNRSTRRTEWQKSLTALEHLRVVFKVECNDLVTLKVLWRALPGRVVADLRPRRMEVDVELVHMWWARECGVKRLGKFEEGMREGMGKVVRLRGEGDESWESE